MFVLNWAFWNAGPSAWQQIKSKPQPDLPAAKKNEKKNEKKAPVSTTKQSSLMEKSTFFSMKFIILDLFWTEFGRFRRRWRMHQRKRRRIKTRNGRRNGRWSPMWLLPVVWLTSLLCHQQSRPGRRLPLLKVSFWRSYDGKRKILQQKMNVLGLKTLWSSGD